MNKALNLYVALQTLRDAEQWMANIPFSSDVLHETAGNDIEQLENRARDAAFAFGDEAMLESIDAYMNEGEMGTAETPAEFWQSLMVVLFVQESNR